MQTIAPAKIHLDPITEPKRFQYGLTEDAPMHQAGAGPLQFLKFAQQIQRNSEGVPIDDPNTGVTMRHSTRGMVSVLRPAQIEQLRSCLPYLVVQCVRASSGAHKVFDLRTDYDRGVYFPREGDRPLADFIYIVEPGEVLQSNGRPRVLTDAPLPRADEAPEPPRARTAPLGESIEAPEGAMLLGNAPVDAGSASENADVRELYGDAQVANEDDDPYAEGGSKDEGGDASEE